MEMEEENLLQTMNDECQDSQDGDDIYTLLATEITIRKCKIEQKKEKSKVLVFRIKELNNQLKHSGKKRMHLMKEVEVISSQRASKVAKNEEVIESRTSLEMVLSDLIQEISRKTAEIEEKSKMLKAAVKKSTDLRDSYKAVYEEFPLAIKRREAANELKRVDIEIRQIKMEIEDFNYKEKLRREITEKRLHIWSVNMAKAYFKIQEMQSENSLLQNKLSGLKKQYEDIKANKSTNQWMSEKLAPIEYGLKRFQEFQKVMASLKSDAVAATFQPRDGGLFNWKNSLLFNYDSNLSFSKKIQKSVDETRMCTDASDSTKKPISRPSTMFKASFQSQMDKGTEFHSQTTKESTNVLYDVKKIVNDSVRIKRKVESESKAPVKKQTKPLAEDGQKSLNITQNIQDQVPFNIKVANQSVEQNCNQISEKKNIDNLKVNGSSNKETVQTNDNLSISSRIKSLTVQTLTVGNKNKNPGQALIENKKHGCESQKNLVSKVTVPSKAHTKDNSKPIVNYQSILQENYNRVDFKDNSDNCETQIENVPMAMEPSSHPDLVPVENNSQSQSQKINSSDHISSQSSEFTSPLELDETTKLHYERIAAESPEFVYPVGPQLFKSHTTARTLEEVQEKVTSHYFSSSPQPDLNTPTSPRQGDYLAMPYSPPANLLQNDSPYMTQVLSPPEANLAGFSFGKSTAPSNKIGQNDGSAGGRFSFDFMSGPAKKSTSSIFSLF